ncbi:MAG: hypothetical protein RLP44_27340 [Aggregatilineales bacterium]
MPTQSVTQIIAQIKAKVPELDAQLRAIHVGNVSDMLDTVWKIAHDEMAILRSVSDPLDSVAIDQAVAVLIHDARRPAWTTFSALSVLLDDEEFSEELSSSVRQNIQSTHQVAGQINTLLDELHDLYQG